MEYDDEVCQCGHSKGYHQPHSLDKHGGKCENCDCDCYTWKGFIKYEDVK